MYQLDVGGKHFALDPDDIKKLDSPFLTTLLDPESKFAQPANGTFVIEADAACFSVFMYFS